MTLTDRRPPSFSAWLHTRAREDKPEQTTGLQPSLDALFNDLATAQHIP